MHVGDLDGSSQRIMGKNWKAIVTVAVHDSDELPLANVIVSGYWNGDSSDTKSCFTDANGQCNVTSGKLNDSQQGNVTFSVDDLSLAPYSYQSADNHDQDGDSDGTAISVSGP